MEAVVEGVAEAGEAAVEVVTGSIHKAVDGEVRKVLIPTRDLLRSINQNLEEVPPNVSDNAGSGVN